MKTEAFQLTADDGTEFYSYLWKPVGQQVTAVVQIVHGMAEHAGRYHEFAEVLTQKGFAVYANDHRGHGKTGTSSGRMVFFAEKNGWDKVVGDIHQLTVKIKTDFPDLPLFLLGHSMGSFLSRDFSHRYPDEISGLIISGTSAAPGILGTLGLIAAKAVCAIKGSKEKSPLLDRLLNGKMNNAFKPTRTEFDWLSRDNACVDRYVDDPLCGEVGTAGFFYDLFYGLIRVNSPEMIAQSPQKLPVFIISGDMDPVGDNAKGVRKVMTNMKNAGVKDISMKLYKGGRHEMLNETNRHDVYQDIITWINDHMT